MYISLVTRWGTRCSFFRLTATYLCSLHGVHLIGCASYSLQQICASYTVCIITDFSPDQTVQRLMHRCNAGELPDASRHHQCITTSGSDTPLPLVWVEHNIYVKVSRKLTNGVPNAKKLITRPIMTVTSPNSPHIALTYTKLRFDRFFDHTYPPSWS